MLHRALQSSSLRGALCVRALRPCARVLRPASVLEQSGRWCSTKAEEPPAESKPVDDKPTVLFEGAKNKLVMHLKMVSIGNLGLAITTTPVLQYVAGAKGMLMSGLFLTFGGGTTAALTVKTARNGQVAATVDWPRPPDPRITPAVLGSLSTVGHLHLRTVRHIYPWPHCAAHQDANSIRRRQGARGRMVGHNPAHRLPPILHLRSRWRQVLPRRARNDAR